MEEIKGKGFNGNQLKVIAIIAMLIDHIAFAFVPSSTFFGQGMHVIGRLTAPIMCYMVAEGYFHTRNVKKYALRLGVFAIISHFAFQFFELGKIPLQIIHGKVSMPLGLTTSVIFTLLLGLLALDIWKRDNLNKVMKIIIIVMLCVLSLIGDWMFFGVLWVLFFGIYHDDFKKQMISFSIIAFSFFLLTNIFMLFENSDLWWIQLFQGGIFLAIPLLKKYNGKRGQCKNLKWAFYIFYPLHLFVIGLLRMLL